MLGSVLLQEEQNISSAAPNHAHRQNHLQGNRTAREEDNKGADSTQSTIGEKTPPQSLGLSRMHGRACLYLSLCGPSYRHPSPSLTQTSSCKSASPPLPCPLIGPPCQPQKALSFQAMSGYPVVPNLEPKFLFFVMWPLFSVFGGWVWVVASRRKIQCELL